MNAAGVRALRTERASGSGTVQESKIFIADAAYPYFIFYAHSTITCLLQCTAHRCKHMGHNLLMQYRLAASTRAPTFFPSIAGRQTEIEGPFVSLHSKT